jgi:putative hydrolase of the HAD superfamily
MVEAGAKATAEEVLEARLALAGVPGLDLDDAVAASFRSPHPVRVAEAGRRAFYDRDPGPLTPFPFAREVLLRVRAVARTVLLSTGHPPTQRKKVEALGLGGLFDEVVYDDMRLDDVVGPSATRPVKEEALAAWLARSGVPPAATLVVGDRVDAEIAAATRLGARALRVRGGEFAARPTPPGVPEADDVRGVLALLGLPPLADVQPP